LLKLLYKAITNPIIGPIVVSSIGIVFLSLFYMPKLSAQNQQERVIGETTKLISLLKHSRAYYTDNVVNKIEKKSNLHINFDHKTDENTVPLPATTIHDLSDILTKSDNVHASFYSNYPFPNRSSRVLDSFQKDSIEFLTKNPDKIFSKSDIIDGKNVYRVATADILTSQTCVNCHNTRADSPKTDWRLHDVRGVLEVYVPISDHFMLSREQIWYVILFIGLVVLTFSLHYGILYFKREKELINTASILENEIQKRTKDLHESNQFLLEYKKAVDASAIVSKSDLFGNIIYVNDAFCKISGFSRDELMGQPHNIVRSPDVEKSFYKEVWKTIKSKNIFKGIIKNRTKNGDSYYVAATIIPILDEDGEILEYLSLRYEITELINAKDRALSAERTKSTFLANMSHEIRTPLNAIIGFSDILCESNLNRDEKEYAKIISRSAKSLLGIINDVLDISKIESGKLDISESAFSFGLFSEHIVELFSIVAKEKNIRFIYKTTPALPHTLVFDSTRLQQVVSNLLSNSIKFTPEGGSVFFDISLLDISNTHAKIKFSIKDSGIGMSKEQQKIVFEPFSQADDGISRKYGGTGLGLAICSDIVKLMGSRIDLSSELGHGSEFSFVLDLRIEESKEQNETKKSKLLFGVCKNEDDSEYLRVCVKNYLLQLGNVVETEDFTQDVDMIFCFDEDKAIEFKKKRDSIKTVYVGDKAKIKDPASKTYFDYFIDLPIYSSKIVNIIHDNSKAQSQKAISDATNKKFNANILVAEDNPNNQRLIDILLSNLGITATIVGNGQEAIDVYKKIKFDMLLMDVNMPELDGVSATKEILKLQRENSLHKVPIIALTANSISGDREKYLEAGMDDYISKPIELNKLIEIIEKYLYKNRDFHTLNVQSTDNNEGFEVYKKSDVMKQLGLNESTVDMLLESFFLTLDDDLSRLQSTIDAKDANAIKSAAHYIKSSCSNLAMNEAAKLLGEIEASATKGETNADITKIKSIFYTIKNGLMS